MAKRARNRSRMTRLSAQEIAARKIEKILIEVDRTVGISEIGALSGGRIHIRQRACFLAVEGNVGQALKPDDTVAFTAPFG